MTNYQCLKTVGCVNTCMLDNMDNEDKVAACAYLCEMTHGYENPATPPAPQEHTGAQTPA